MQTAVALAVVAAALAYLVARCLAAARSRGCGGACGARHRCPVVKDALGGRA